MNVLIAPDKFKLCLSAGKVAAAIATGLRQVDCRLNLDLCPLADGGEGTVDALTQATQGRLIHQQVTGPLPTQSVDATMGQSGNGHDFFIEMAAASGLHLLAPAQHNPLTTTTFGTGQLLLAAIKQGARRIILGIGGSATTDGGLGCAQACGAIITLDDGTALGPASRPLVGADLPHIASVYYPPQGLLPHNVELIAACDVTNPLYGPAGAAGVFGPQKGATPSQVIMLDSALARLASLMDRSQQAIQPGAGAAGGLGFALATMFAAQLKPGIQIVMEAAKLPDRLPGTDLCITGEGRFDSQSLSGKVAIGVARLCKEKSIPCIVLAGSLGDGIDSAADHGVSACFSICDRPMKLEEAISDAPRLLASAAANVLKAIQCGHLPK